MNQQTRRTFLRETAALGAAAIAGPALTSRMFAAEERGSKRPIAAVVTEYRKNSHADVIIGKILEGFEHDGGPGPDIYVASMYTDQVPESDMSRALSAKHGFPIFDTIAEAITVGTSDVAVDGVLAKSALSDPDAAKAGPRRAAIAPAAAATTGSSARTSTAPGPMRLIASAPPVTPRAIVKSLVLVSLPRGMRRCSPWLADPKTKTPSGPSRRAGGYSRRPRVARRPSSCNPLDLDVDRSAFDAPYPLAVRLGKENL